MGEDFLLRSAAVATAARTDASGLERCSFDCGGLQLCDLGTVWTAIRPAPHDGRNALVGARSQTMRAEVQPMFLLSEGPSSHTLSRRWQSNLAHEAIQSKRPSPAPSAPSAAQPRFAPAPPPAPPPPRGVAASSATIGQPLGRCGLCCQRQLQLHARRRRVAAQRQELAVDAARRCKHNAHEPGSATLVIAL